MDGNEAVATGMLLAACLVVPFGIFGGGLEGLTPKFLGMGIALGSFIECHSVYFRNESFGQASCTNVQHIDEPGTGRSCHLCFYIFAGIPFLQRNSGRGFCCCRISRVNNYLQKVAISEWNTVP
jgi:hypothetical protein